MFKVYIPQEHKDKISSKYISKLNSEDRLIVSLRIAKQAGVNNDALLVYFFMTVICIQIHIMPKMATPTF